MIHKIYAQFLHSSTQKKILCSCTLKNENKYMYVLESESLPQHTTSIHLVHTSSAPQTQHRIELTVHLPFFNDIIQNHIHLILWHWEQGWISPFDLTTTQISYLHLDSSRRRLVSAAVSSVSDSLAHPLFCKLI